MPITTRWTEHAGLAGGWASVQRCGHHRQHARRATSHVGGRRHLVDDLPGDGPELVGGGADALSDRLVKVALEECVHHMTQATDNSRDFQDFLLDLAVKLARRQAGSPSQRTVAIPG